MFQIDTLNTSLTKLMCENQKLIDINSSLQLKIEGAHYKVTILIKAIQSYSLLKTRFESVSFLEYSSSNFKEFKLNFKEDCKTLLAELRLSFSRFSTFKESFINYIGSAGILIKYDHCKSKLEQVCVASDLCLKFEEMKQTVESLIQEMVELEKIKGLSKNSNVINNNSRHT